MYDEKLAAGIPATAIVEFALTSHVVAESDRIVARFEGDEVCAVDAAVFNLPRAKEDTVCSASVVSLVAVNQHPECGEQNRDGGNDGPLLRA